MSLTLTEKQDGRILAIEVTGKLTGEDYNEFVPRVERLIQKHGKISVLMEMKDFHGWDARALWEDLKFDVRHFADIERLAMVGEKKWEAGMSDFCRPFTTASIRYFDRADIDQAWQWITGIREDVEGRPPPATLPPYPET